MMLLSASSNKKAPLAFMCQMVHYRKFKWPFYISFPSWWGKCIALIRSIVRGRYCSWSLEQPLKDTAQNINCCVINMHVCKSSMCSKLIPHVMAEYMLLTSNAGVCRNAFKLISKASTSCYWTYGTTMYVTIIYIQQHIQKNHDI